MYSDPKPTKIPIQLDGTVNVSPSGNSSEEWEYISAAPQNGKVNGDCKLNKDKEMCSVQCNDEYAFVPTYIDENGDRTTVKKDNKPDTNYNQTILKREGNERFLDVPKCVGIGTAIENNTKNLSYFPDQDLPWLQLYFNTDVNNQLSFDLTTCYTENQDPKICTDIKDKGTCNDTEGCFWGSNGPNPEKCHYGIGLSDKHNKHRYFVPTASIKSNINDAGDGNWNETAKYLNQDQLKFLASDQCNAFNSASGFYNMTYENDVNHPGKFNSDKNYKDASKMPGYDKDKTDITTYSKKIQDQTPIFYDNWKSINGGNQFKNTKNKINHNFT